jgi:hypothetical protein
LLVAQGKVGGGGKQRLLRSQHLAHASGCWQGVGGSALTENWQQCWGIGGARIGVGVCWDSGG